MKPLKVVTGAPQPQIKPPPPQPQPLERGRLDDDDLALALADTWADKAAYFHGDWHIYDAGVWGRRDIQEVRRAIRVFLRDYRKRGVSVTQRQINALAGMMEDDLFIPDRRLIEMAAEAKPYINLRNGLYNLETRHFEPHTPENARLYLTTQLDFDYDEDADCPHFRRYLNTSLVKLNGETDQELIQLALEALAYSMTARTDLKASFWLVGAPDSGKSTMIAIIRALMGNLHATVDLNQLATNRFLLAGIVGKRVVTFTEAQGNVVLPDALYKAMTGGTDEIYVDVKNKTALTFVPQAKFWWAMNEPPRITDRSAATFNRLRVIPFNRSVPQSERIYGLDQLVKQEAAGVFNWLMFAWARVQRVGELIMPEQSTRVRDEYQNENDTEKNYLQERTMPDLTARIQSQILYDDYRDWCVRNGFKAKNVNQVAKEWRRLGLTAVKDNVMQWEGAKLKSSMF